MSKVKGNYAVHLRIGDYLNETHYEWNEYLNNTLWECYTPYLPSPKDLLDISQLLEQETLNTLLEEFKTSVFEVVRRKLVILDDRGDWFLYIKPVI